MPENEMEDAGPSKRKPKRSIFRFSLRQLLFLTALVAVGVIYWLHLMKQMQLERNIAMKLEWSCFLETEPASWPISWMAKYSPDGKTDHVVGVATNRSVPNSGNLGPEDVPSIALLPHLRTIEIRRDIQWSALTLDLISKCTSLETLKVWGNLTNEDILQLAKLPRLKHFEVENEKADWKVVEFFLNQSRVKFTLLTYESPAVDDADIDLLLKAIQTGALKLRDPISRLSISNSTSSTIPKALDAFPELEWLRVDDPIAINPESISKIESSVRIELINCSDAKPSWWTKVGELFMSRNLTVGRDEDDQPSTGRLDLMKIDQKDSERISVELQVYELSPESILRNKDIAVFANLPICVVDHCSAELTAKMLSIPRRADRVNVSNCDLVNADVLRLDEVNTTSLYIQSCPNLSSFSYPLKNNAKRFYLSFSNCPNLKSIQEVELADNLTELSLYDMNDFDGFQSLKNCKNLRSISIEKCAQLKELKWLPPNVRDISVEDCPNLDSKAEIEHLK